MRMRQLNELVILQGPGQGHFAWLLIVMEVICYSWNIKEYCNLSMIHAFNGLGHFSKKVRCVLIGAKWKVLILIFF